MPLSTNPAGKLLWNTYRSFPPGVFAATADYIAAHEDFDFMQTGKTLSINLSLSNDAEVQKLNAEFRHLDKPTNVLSFANIDDECFDDMVAESDVIDSATLLSRLKRCKKKLL